MTMAQDQIHGDARMNDFKVVSVIYVLNVCTVWLRYDLSCTRDYDRVRVELYIEKITMRLLLL